MQRRGINRKKLLFAGITLSTAAAAGYFSGAGLHLQAAIAVVRNDPSALVASSLRHDFGQVNRGERLKTSFPVANRGGRRLILYREDGDCSCSTSDAELRLAPGGSGELTAELDTQTLTGAIQTQIHYRTNDPSTPTVTLTLIADIVTQ